MKLFNRACATCAVVLLGMTAGIAAPPPSPATPAQSVMPAATPAGHDLTRADLSAWLDGYMRYARRRGDVAGAVVVVVKDGQVLLEKGYGYSDMDARTKVDPKTTLFRPGSVSKLFTWTAVMQQVEAGKIDLDADINRYLDFKIPPAFGKPITMRDLMTHTPGFEETVKYLFKTDPKEMRQLHDVVADWIPERMFPPGEVSAYSNYGATLAGYIVQRVSGEPFAEYIQRHIFTPLGMAQATFEQPLPKRLAPDMSKGYKLGSGKPQPFEYIDMVPAGGLSASGDAMTRFMLAYLNGGTYNGARILSPKSVALMWSNQHAIAPGMPPIGLGFYHEDQNGYEVVGHGGDTDFFHSELALIPAEHLGIFISQNSAGRAGGMLRGPLIDGFMERYFPAPPPPHLPTAKTAKADGARVAGHYIVSRRSDSSFMRVAALLGQVSVASDKDGIVTVDVLKDLNGQPMKWREVGPLRWQEVHGRHVLVATEKDERIAGITSDLVPAILTVSPAPFWRNASWSVPLLVATALMLVLTVVFWPVKAILRWRYDRPFDLAGRKAWLYRGTRAVALVDLMVFAGWATFLTLVDGDTTLLSDKTDWLVRLLEILGIVGVIGTVVPFWDLIVSLPDRTRPWWTKATTFLVALACLSFAWFAVTEGLVWWTVNY